MAFQMSKLEKDSQKLPDTLTPAEPLTITQESNEQHNNWGVLIAKRPYLSRIDLVNDTYVLGRKPTCQITIDGTSMEPTFVHLISKEHFLISRDSTLVPYIQDLSKNGTYINGALIGKNRRIALCNGDIISVGTRKLEVFEFKDEFDSEDTNEIDGKYIITKFLGCGAFGEVYLALAKKTRERFAIKKMKLNPLTDKKTHTEIQILQSLNHTSIVRMEEFIFQSNHVYIVLEYMRGGELLGKILEKRQLSESLAKFYFYQIVLAVKYLHKEGITHRDLKPENILLETKNDITLVKVSDFGLSKILSEASVMMSVCGTLTYAAPEILNDEHTYTKKVDIWSLGCIFYFMLFGSVPFCSVNGEPRQKVRNRILNGTYTLPAEPNVSDNAIDLIKVMLTVDPTQRISAAEIYTRGSDQDEEVLQKINKLIRSNDKENTDDNNK